MYTIFFYHGTPKKEKTYFASLADIYKPLPNTSATDGTACSGKNYAGSLSVPSAKIYKA